MFELFQSSTRFDPTQSIRYCGNFTDGGECSLNTCKAATIAYGRRYFDFDTVESECHVYSSLTKDPSSTNITLSDNAFDIYQLVCDPTFAPTSAPSIPLPTVDPSVSPTSKPTMTPHSSNPSISPSVNPSNHQTRLYLLK